MRKPQNSLKMTNTFYNVSTKTTGSGQSESQTSGADQGERRFSDIKVASTTDSHATISRWSSTFDFIVEVAERTRE